jgi:aldose 1-epimerase
VVRIQDGGLVVSIDPSAGNNAYSMTVHGHEIVWAHAQPGHTQGIPLLAPWANRIDGEEYFANGRKYLLNPGLDNLHYDGNHLPIHGLLAFADRWKVIRQDASSVTSRLEFWKFPTWMAQFPFAHTVEITHRLRDGSLEVETAVENHSTEPMPLCIGYHPYFQLTDSPRDEWKIHIAATEQVVLSERLIPTGEQRPNALADPLLLAGVELDSVFTRLTGAPFRVHGKSQQIEVRFGSKFPVAIVYAPKGKEFVCFEPMTAWTNAFNLDHAGIASELQRVSPGATWKESFWVTPIGFSASR